MKWNEDVAKIVSVSAGVRDSGEPYCNAKIQMWGGTISAKVPLERKDEFLGYQGKKGKASGDLDYESNQWGVKATFHIDTFKAA